MSSFATSIVTLLVTDPGGAEASPIVESLLSHVVENPRAMLDSSEMQSAVSVPDGYDVRWFEDRDRSAFIDLYELAFGDCTEEWFSWKYEENPYADEVPIVVAERDGEVGAVRPFVPLPLRLGDRLSTARQLVDMVVHPDHRRNGLMTALSRWTKTASWNECAATLTYATPAVRRGILQMTNEQWTDHDLGPFVKYERIHDISAFVDEDDSLPARLGASVASPVYRARHRLRDRFAGGVSGLRVNRHDTVPMELLVELYETEPPAAAHVHRDEALYGWRFAEPGSQYATYVARRNGSPVAAIVVETAPETAGPQTARLLEVVPLAGGDDRADAFSALLSEITTDYSTVDHISAAEGAIPQQVFAEHGFIRTDTPPLSTLVDPSYVLVCPLGGVADDPRASSLLVDDWEATFVERRLG